MQNKTTSPIKTIKNPRLSVNTFSEFNHAGSSRRSKIITENKYPKDGESYGKYRLRLVTKPIHNFIVTQDKSIIDAAKKQVDGMVVPSNTGKIPHWKKSDKSTSLELLGQIGSFDFKKFHGLQLKLIQ